MIRSLFGVVVTIVVLTAGGCRQDESLPSDGTPAEVPGPGPAADPGPAPEGQWEPPVEETAAPESATPVEEDTANPPASSQTEGARVSVERSRALVSLKIQRWEETEKLIASHRGKVVVVDFWSTSCLPCRREFPHLVELHNAHADDVACISISLDYSGRASRPPDSYREQVYTFLAEQGARFDNVLSSDDPDELQARLNLAPIPLVWVYDRQGNLARQFDNSDLQGEEFTYEKDVVPFAESLLAVN